MIIAVDFDGTLHFSRGKTEGIGEPNIDLIKKLINKQQNGDQLILWTCRDGKSLDEAVEWCKQQGLVFDAINDNLPNIKEAHTQQWGSMGRKIYANIYLDDKAVNPREFMLLF